MLINDNVAVQLLLTFPFLLKINMDKTSKKVTKDPTRQEKGIKSHVMCMKRLKKQILEDNCLPLLLRVTLNLLLLLLQVTLRLLPLPLQLTLCLLPLPMPQNQMVLMFMVLVYLLSLPLVFVYFLHITLSLKIKHKPMKKNINHNDFTSLKNLYNK